MTDQPYPHDDDRRPAGRRLALLGAGRAIMGLAAGSALLLPAGARAQSAGKDARGPGAGRPTIRQPAVPSPAAFMAVAERMRALALKAGDQGFGAVVVKGRGAAARIVGLGPSRVVTDSDPTAHAEMEAVRDACRRLGTRDLSDCTLYSTFRPCRMCETGAYWARVGQYVYGTGLTNGGKPRYGC